MLPHRCTAPLVAAVLLTLAACASAPPPAPPLAGVEAPPGWAQPVPAGAGPLAQWWRVFGDATLVDLVEAAQRGNSDVAAARASLLQARALREQAAATLWPALSASGSVQRSRAAAADSRNRFQAGLDAAWEADLFGFNAHTVGAQQALAQRERRFTRDGAVSVAADVALAYLDLRGAPVRTGGARETLAAQEETLQISRWRQQAGLANSVEVEQASTAVEQTRAQVPALQAAAARSAHALAVLVGQPPATLLPRLAAPRPVPQPQAGLAVAIPAQVLRQRADVLAAERQLRAAAEQVAAADAQRRPSPRIEASLAWSGLTLGSLASASAARSLLAAVAQPLFDAGRLDAQLAAREAAFDVAREGYRATVLAALQEVEDALAALAADRERLASLQRALAAARNAALLAQQRHTSGLIDFQTVLDTQRTLLAVQDSVAGGEAALAADHVRLFKALGGGWSPADAESAS